VRQQPQRNRNHDALLAIEYGEKGLLSARLATSRRKLRSQGCKNPHFPVGFHCNARSLSVKDSRTPDEISSPAEIYD
jgi:hypothetical protein